MSFGSVSQDSVETGKRVFATLPDNQRAQIQQSYPNGISNEVFEELSKLADPDRDSMFAQYRSETFDDILGRISDMEEGLNSPDISTVNRITLQHDLSLLRKAYEDRKASILRNYLDMSPDGLQQESEELQRNIVGGNETIELQERMNIIRQISALTPDQLIALRFHTNEPFIRADMENESISELEERLRSAGNSPEDVLFKRLINEIIAPNYIPERVKRNEDEERRSFSDQSIRDLEFFRNNAIKELNSPRLTPSQRAIYNQTKRLTQNEIDKRRPGTTVRIIFRPYLEIYVPRGQQPIIVGLPLVNVDPSLNESIETVLDQLVHQITPEDRVYYEINPNNWTVTLTLNYKNGISPQHLLVTLSRIRNTAIPLNLPEFSQYNQVTLGLNIDRVESITEPRYTQVDLRALGFTP
jgi:hypothetical protein